MFNAATDPFADPSVGPPAGPFNAPSADQSANWSTSQQHALGAADHVASSGLHPAKR